MIISGYSGIGKSTLASKNKNVVDLDSSLFKIDGKRFPDWYKAYVNVAVDLSRQGFIVLVSAHMSVRNELKKRNIDFYIICPSQELKNQWVERLNKRYQKTKLLKDLCALNDSKDNFDNDIKSMLKEKNCIIINKIEYNLYEFVQGLID